MLEVEVKVRVLKPIELLNFLKEQGFSVKRLEIEDLYLSHPCKDLVSSEEEVRVRYDMVERNILLTYKAPKIENDRSVRIEVEEEIKEDVVNILFRLGFKPMLKKRKRGWRLINEDLKLDLVEVSGVIDSTTITLGYFLEVEILVENEEDMMYAREKIKNLIRRLPYLGEVEDRFYTEMIVEKFNEREKKQ